MTAGWGWVTSEGQIGGVHMGDRSGSMTIRLGKQENFRQVPLPKEIRHALRAYLGTHSNDNDPDSSLWIGTRGALTHRSSVLRLLQKYALQAGLVLYPWGRTDHEERKVYG